MHVESGKTMEAVAQVMADFPTMSLSQVQKKLKHFNRHTVKGCFYKLRADAQATSNMVVKEKLPEKERSGVERMDIRIGIRPLNIGLINGHMIGTLQVSGEGIAFRKANAKKPSGRTLKWDTLHAVMESGLLG